MNKYITFSIMVTITLDCMDLQQWLLTAAILIISLNYLMPTRIKEKNVSLLQTIGGIFSSADDIIIRAMTPLIGELPLIHTSV